MVHPKPSRFVSFVLWMLALMVGIVFWGLLITYSLARLMD